MPKPAPRRKVVSAKVLGGGSILQPGFKHHWWQLDLECGHTVERRIRWKSVPNPRRGWAALHHGPSLARLPDTEPQHANCEVCVVYTPLAWRTNAATSLVPSSLLRRGVRTGACCLGTSHPRTPVGHAAHDDILLAHKAASYLYALHHVSATTVFGDRDPYLRQQRAAEHWLAAHGPASDERAVRVYGMLRFGGHKGLATAMVRGWRERLAQPGVPWGLEWQADRTGYLMCPYRYSQHGGASPGGGTWAAQWRKAWVRGVQFANQHLRALPPQ